MSTVIRMNIFCRRPGGEWQLFDTPVAEDNGEPISQPWGAADLFDALDNYVDDTDTGDEWYATLVDDTGRVLVECESFVR